MDTEIKSLLQFLPRLRRYAQVLTRNVHDAEDLVQETLLKAHRHASGATPGPETGGGWLMSTLHNTFIDHHRSRSASRRRETDFAQLMPQIMDAPQEMAVRLAQLRRRLLDLPTEQREALHLVAIEGMAYSEAAAMLSIPQGTLMSRLSRARSALKRMEDGPRMYVVGERDVS